MPNREYQQILNAPKCENFDLLFFTLRNHIWVGDRRTAIFLFFMKIEADIRHFIFFTPAECALKIGYVH
jgi:hypothetical protein